ncbi:AhpC/TSA antioxidant enzyme-domain-containing protein [Mycena sp. CBHHK59/15]|nr:AhpC/TSA antioxidant enzyme-domain-containing protein [Mycena sp. CBHHK59/15]
MSLLDALPETSVLDLAARCQVLDVEGTKIDFGSIFAQQKTVVVFIRHFWCGAYVEDLAVVPDAALERTGTRIVIIGCGDWKPIHNYAEITGFRGPIYADPSRKLYQTLGMNIESLALTPADQEKPSYIKEGLMSSTWKAIKTGPLRNPSHIGKNGNISQLGGDFILGPGNDCTFAHRMQNTEDHIEVADLMKAAGVTLT